MNHETKDFLGTYFDPEVAGYEDDYRVSLRNMPATYGERVKSGVTDLLRTRSLSLMEFYRVTRTDLVFENEDDLYAAIAKAYEHLFGEPAPPYAGTT